MALYSAEDGSHLRNWWLKTPHKWLNSSAIINNVEKLQDMVQNTIQNIEEAHETMQFASGEEKQNIIEKNKRREEAIEGFRSEIQDEAHDR